MTPILSRATLLVGGALVLATLLGLLVSSSGGAGSTLGAVVVLLVGFGKALLVLHWFMELNTAPRRVRRAIDAVVATAAAGLVVMLLL